MAEDSKLHHLGWFIAGLGVGALIGVLYAPKSGRETREDLVNSACEGGEFLRNRARDAADGIHSLVGRSRDQVSDFVDRGRSQWDEFVERGKNLVSDQTTRVAAAVDAGRQAYKSTSINDPSSEL